MKAVLLLVLAATADLLGPPVRQDGYSFRPPRPFHIARMDLFHQARPLAIGASADSQGTLSAALVDGDDENAASLIVAVIDEPFSVGPGARDEFSAQVARHFRERLGLEFSLERAELIEGPSRRVEVLGSVRRSSQLRQIVAAAWPGDTRHVVITCSVPSGRWEALSGSLAQSFETVRIDGGGSTRAPRNVVLAVAALAAALLAASAGLWRRRKALSPER
jgi:hypothetical protein